MKEKVQIWQICSLIWCCPEKFSCMTRFFFSFAEIWLVCQKMFNIQETHHVKSETKLNCCCLYFINIWVWIAVFVFVVRQRRKSRGETDDEDEEMPPEDPKITKEIEELSKFKDHSGIGKIIYKELEEKRAHPIKALDPWKASRVPGADHEPRYSTRYQSPMFACKTRYPCSTLYS